MSEESLKEESVALVPTKRVIPTFDEGLPAECRTFLELYVKMQWVGKAADALGISRNQHRRWAGGVIGCEAQEVPGFAAAFDIAMDDVSEQKNEWLGELNEKGLCETTYDKDGKLKGTRYRQSEGLIKMELMAQDRARYANEAQGGSNVNIVVVMADE